MLNHTRELNLQTSRQIQAVLRLQQVGHATLAGLTVDANDGFVRTTQVFRVNRQVRNTPHNLVNRLARSFSIHGHALKALLDRVLVRSRKSGIDQVACIRVTLVNGELVAVLHRATNLVDAGEVDHGVDALREQVQAQGD